MKRIIFLIIIVICILIINSLIRSIYDLWQKKDLITAAQKELTKQKSQNQRLKSELSYVGNPEFIEQVARNKLFFVKPQEQRVLLDRELAEGNKTTKNPANEPNWKKWWELFF